jgi:protein-disulfide isomerase
VFRQFPLEQLHAKALPVALASECVAELGGNSAFWTFADGYFRDTLTNDRTDIETVIPKLVLESGVSQDSFEECFVSGRVSEAVQEDLQNAIETGGRGTPWSILIGPTGKTYPVNGALPAAAVEQIIEKALAEA